LRLKNDNIFLIVIYKGWSPIWCPSGPIHPCRVLPLPLGVRSPGGGEEEEGKLEIEKKLVRQGEPENSGTLVVFFFFLLRH